MGASVFVRILLVPALLIAIPGVGYTQPLAWSVQQHPVSQIGPYVTRLQVRNLATGVVEASFDIPDRIEAGHGVLSPDSRYYLLPTNIGIARFVTSPPALDTILGAGVAVRELFIEPVGARLHAVGDFGHAVLDWDTGALLSLECCAQQRILFTPDGSKSITIEPRGSRSAPTETVVNVFAEPVHTLQWSITVSGRIDSPVVSDSNLALVSSGLGQVLIGAWRTAPNRGVSGRPAVWSGAPTRCSSAASDDCRRSIFPI